MSYEASASRRRHILSSINPEEAADHVLRRESRSASPKREPSQHSPPRQDVKDADRDDDELRPRRSRLKLKSHRSRRRSRSRSHERHDDRPSHRSSRRHRRHRRRHKSPTPPNPYEEPVLDPEAAFRESLFDAMADDEGAAYWEGVYGQPVHVYSNDKVGPTGELEQMTDEEYAGHVRQKMWEKTHAGLLEERARREERKKQKQEQERRSRKLQEDMDRSLRKGEERRQMRRWRARWEEYVAGWAAWDGALDTLPWPLEGGRRTDFKEQDVRSFFIHGLGLEELDEKAFVAKLKDERVRWHPDKVQQKLGGQVDADVMKDVTFIFQIIDRLWVDSRPKA